jgi:thioredoxin reductase (NADPH)
MAWNGSFALTVGSEVYQGNALVLAPGVVRAAKYPGEEALLGRGVSYCATCDGMLYRGKTIAVVSTSAEFEHEAAYLADLAEKVYYIPLYRGAILERENLHILSQIPRAVLGAGRVEALQFDEEAISVDGVFFLKAAVSPSALVMGLETEGGHVIVDRHCRTNLPGCFAAGDCTGRPYQYVKAAGEGNVAAHAVVQYLSEI